MDWTTIITSIITFVAGGGIFTLVTIGLQKKKLKAEVKASDIDNMRKAMEDFYAPLLKAQDDRIASQNVRIAELETEVKTLRDEKRQTEDRHQQEIAELRKQNADLQKQITDITRALGIKANKQLRNVRGQFTAEKEAK